MNRTDKQQLWAGISVQQHPRPPRPRDLVSQVARAEPEASESLDPPVPTRRKDRPSSSSACAFGRAVVRANAVCAGFGGLLLAVERRQSREPEQLSWTVAPCATDGPGTWCSPELLCGTSVCSQQDWCRGVVANAAQHRPQSEPESVDQVSIVPAYPQTDLSLPTALFEIRNLTFLSLRT